MGTVRGQRGLRHGVKSQSSKHEAARMARRRIFLSLGGLGVSGNLAGNCRPTWAREEAREVSCDVKVEQLRGGLGPDDVPARLTFALTEKETGTPILWKDLASFSSTGCKPHALHVHVYDEDDPDIPGIEVGHVHPEDFGNPAASRDGKYDVEFEFPHPGAYTVELSYLLASFNNGAAPKTIRVPVTLVSKYDGA